MKLLCFPYAGGTSTVFLKWEKYSTGIIEVIPVDISGHGRRMTEPLCSSVAEVVNDLKRQTVNLIDNEEEYAIYGHSMACLLIYELLHSLLESGFKMPVHVFLSGKNPPDVPVQKAISRMDNPAFVEQILNLGGMDADFFENQTLANLFIPILKKDFGMIENYSFERKKQELPVDMSFFFSDEDTSISIDRVKHWADFINGRFDLYRFKGKHFFIFDHVADMVRIMEQTLEESILVPY